MGDPLAASGAGNTPLSTEERDGLIPTWITTRGELNEAEASNILEARTWVSIKKRDVLSEKFLLNLHQRMLNKVWRWAGTIRKSEKNIGVEPQEIEIKLRSLIDDVRYWIAHATYPPDEIATRFHHRLVWIHIFPNGNGRHARMAANLLLESLGRPHFTWGSTTQTDLGETRRHYIEALRQADSHDYAALLAFVRT